MNPPWWIFVVFLLFLCAVPAKLVLVRLVKLKLKQNPELQSRFEFPSLWRFVWVSLFGSLVLVFSYLALFRTSATELEISSSNRSLDILFVVDVSFSMNAEDTPPNRLQVFQNTLLQNLPRLAGNRLGIVVFAGKAFSFCPMTTDIAAFADYVKALGPEMVGDKGTDLDQAFQKTKTLL